MSIPDPVDDACGEIVRLRIWWNGHPGDDIDKRLTAMLPCLDSGCGYGIRDVACFLPKEAAQKIVEFVKNMGCEARIVYGDA